MADKVESTVGVDGADGEDDVDDLNAADCKTA